MTFEDLSKQLNTSVQSLQNLTQVLSAAFADMEGGGGSSGYSTEEHIVGKWIDGSDIYEKTIIKTGLNFQDSFAVVDATLTVSYVKDIISYDGSVKTADGAGITSLCGLPGMNLWIFGVHNNVNGLGLYGSAANALQGGSAIVTVRYTKK